MRLIDRLRSQRVFRRSQHYLSRQVMAAGKNRNGVFRYVGLGIWLLASALMILDRFYWNVWPRQTICTDGCGNDFFCDMSDVSLGNRSASGALITLCCASPWSFTLSSASAPNFRELPPSAAISALNSTQDPGCLKAGPWTAKVFDAVARISARLIISTTK